MRRKKSDERRARVTDLWNQQPESFRSAKNAVLEFYVWLQEHSPDALQPRNQGDPYEELKRNLGDYIRKDQL
jgi:hypothetical protein